MQDAHQHICAMASRFVAQHISRTFDEGYDGLTANAKQDYLLKILLYTEMLQIGFLTPSEWDTVMAVGA